MSPSVLVAGIGNIFLGDDGFGVEVADRMAGLALPAGVRVEEFGIRGVHLAYELLDGYDGLVLVDAVPLGEVPGTLAVLEPESDGTLLIGDDIAPVVDAHSMSPEVVLATLVRLGGSVARTYVVGCQPATFDEGIGLSPPVAAAVDGAIELCTRLVVELGAGSRTISSCPSASCQLERGQKDDIPSGRIVGHRVHHRPGGEVATRHRPLPEDPGDVR
jgi:hydrogenase maturation protease